VYRQYALVADVSWRDELSDDPPRVRELQEEIRRGQRVVAALSLPLGMCVLVEAMLANHGRLSLGLGTAVMAATCVLFLAVMLPRAHRMDRLRIDINSERQRTGPR
jgi:hypothetical protein